MKTALYHTRLGKPIILRRNQADALIRAGVWLTLGYTYIDASTTDEPTYTDDIIVTMIRQYPKMALVCKPSHQDNGPEFPFRIISAARSSERNAWCRSFGAAAQWVRDIHHCDVLLMPVCDMQEDYYAEAGRQRICLLAVTSIIDVVPGLSDGCEYH